MGGEILIGHVCTGRRGGSMVVEERRRNRENNTLISTATRILLYGMDKSGADVGRIFLMMETLVYFGIHNTMEWEVLRKLKVASVGIRQGCW